MAPSLIADVAPLRRLPPRLSAFTYRVPSEIAHGVSPGSAVAIPFRNLTITGIVLSVTRGVPDANTRDIVRVLPDLSLTREQLFIVRTVARELYESTAVVLNSFLPHIPKRAAKHSRMKSETRAPLGKKAVPEATRLSSARNRARTGYLFYNNYQDLFHYIRQVIAALSKGEQLVICAPEHTHRNLAYLAASGSGASVVLFPSRQKKHEYADAWQMTRTAQVVIGSVTALFSPFQKLRQIVVIEAEHRIFQAAEQSPRFHLADIIFLAADQYRARLVLTGFSPDVALLYHMRTRSHPIQTLGKLKNPPIIVTSDTRSAKGVGVIPYHIFEAIQSASGPVLVVFNKLGDTRLLHCKDCGYRALCDACAKPMVIEADSQQITCFICGSKKPLPTLCPHCGGTRLQRTGMGVDRIASDLRREFPKRQVVVVSSEHVPVQRSATNRLTIIVATHKIFSQPNQRFDIGIALNPDADVFRAQYHAAENARYYLRKLSSLCEQTYVVTANPEHYLYRTMLSVADFYAEEIEWRKTFGFPPFRNRYAVTLRGKDVKDFKSQRELLIRHFSALGFQGPFDIVTRSGAATKIVIADDAAHRKVLDALMASSYNTFRVEFNPYSLL